MKWRNTLKNIRMGKIYTIDLICKKQIEMQYEIIGGLYIIAYIKLIK